MWQASPRYHRVLHVGEVIRSPVCGAPCVYLWNEGGCFKALVLEAPFVLAGLDAPYLYVISCITVCTNLNSQWTL